MDMYGHDSAFNDLCDGLLGGIFEMDLMNEAQMRALQQEEMQMEEEALALLMEQTRLQEEEEARAMAAAFAELQAETQAKDKIAREAEKQKELELASAKNKEKTHFEKMLAMNTKPTQKTVDPLAGRKNLKNMLRDDDDKKEITLPQPVIDFLQAGSMLMKHSKGTVVNLFVSILATLPSSLLSLFPCCVVYRLCTCAA